VCKTASKTKPFLVSSLVFTVVVFFCAGCGGAFNPRSADKPSTLDPFSQLDLSKPSSFEAAIGADKFASAQRLALAYNQTYTVNGTIAPGEIHVFDIGPVVQDDHVTAEMFSSSAVSGAIALFNENEQSLLVNDDRNVYLGRTEPFIDLVMRRGQQHTYVVVSSSAGSDSSIESIPAGRESSPAGMESSPAGMESSPAGGESPSVGGESQSAGVDYTLAINIEPASPLPLSRPQVVLLNFAGALDVQIGSRPKVNVPPFDAANISTKFAGQTAQLKALVTSAVRKDFSGFDVIILSTSELEPALKQDRMNAKNISRLHFGTFDARLLGIAQNVDEYNLKLDQNAIVFTDTFAAFMPLNPSLSEIATAIANVASHEIGHLLGLVHTSDPTGVMDISASLPQMLQDQHFTISPLHSTVFPIGSENAPLYLMDSVGGDLSVIKQAAARYSAAKSLYLPRSFPRVALPDRKTMVFGSCGM